MSNQQQSLVDEQAAPDSWEAWQPEAIETPWWCGQWGSAGAAAFIWFAGSPVVMGSLCSGPIFGPTPVSGIVGAIVAGAGMVGAFIAFASAAKKSTPWQPVREEVEQPAPAGSAESVRQVLAETVEGLRAGTVSKQVADSVLRVAKVQLAVAEQGGGLLAAAPEKAKGAAVKRWLHSRGYVRASKGGRTAWLPAEQFGWQSA